MLSSSSARFLQVAVLGHALIFCNSFQFEFSFSRHCEACVFVCTENIFIELRSECAAQMQLANVHGGLKEPGLQPCNVSKVLELTGYA